MTKVENGKTFHIGDFQIDIIVHGFPGKSVCHGPLGFSTIAMIRHGDRIALVDVGGFGQRLLLLDRLTELGLKMKDLQTTQSSLEEIFVNLVKGNGGAGK